MSEETNPQSAFWNGQSGLTWVEGQPFLDEAFSGCVPVLTAAVEASGAKRVLDIGCGTGAVSLALAERPGMQVPGVDISEPMLSRAKARAIEDSKTVSFIRADAQDYPFEACSFDHIVSRFGVMFFEDAVAAFTNIHRASAAGAAMTLLAWRSPKDNPFMRAPKQAADPWLPEDAFPPPGRTGQFGWADADYVRDMLAKAGWQNVSISPLNIDCAFPEAALSFWMERMGPVGRIVSELEAEPRKAAMQAMGKAMAEYVSDGMVRFKAAIWKVEAEKA